MPLKLTAGGRIFWLILSVASLTGRLYSQAPEPNFVDDPDLLGCNAYDFVVIHCTPARTPGTRWPMAFSLLRLPSLRLSGDQNGWHSGLGAGLSETPTPNENGPWTGTTSGPGLGAVTLWAQRQAGPPDDPKSKNQSTPSTTKNSPGHIFWVVPAYKVDYGKGFKPLTPKEKFAEWAQGAYDPLGLASGGVEAATLEHSSKDGFCGYGHGLGGYGECFGSLELDSIDSSFIGDFALPVLLHQDPRYFRMGEGPFGKRLWYAVSRVFLTYNDSGHTVLYTSALSGTVIAAGLSNLYYPSQDVGAGHTMTRIAIDLGNSALFNLAAEFWPEIKRKLQHTF